MRRLLLAGLGLLLIALALLVRELRRAPLRADRPPGTGEVDPITDVAGQPLRGPPPTAGVTGQAGPRAEEEPAPPSLPPREMPDPANPPHGTQPRAMPGTPTPPDPYVPPELAQDPERGRQPHGG